MTCTKAQLLALLFRLRRDLLNCRDMDCVRIVIDHYIELVQDRAETEAWRELVTP